MPAGVVMVAEVAQRLEGAGLNVSLTQSFSGPGDLDGDGLDDLVIGAPAFAPDAPDAAVYVMRGPADHHVLEAETVLRGDGAKGVDLMVQADRIEGPQTDGRLGQHVHAGDDFDGDGLADLVISAGYIDGGGVHLLFGMR